MSEGAVLGQNKLQSEPELPDCDDILNSSNVTPEIVSL